MRIGRVLLFIGLLLLVVALAAGGFMLWRTSQPDEPPPSEMEGAPEPVVVSTVPIVVAAQNIPRGMKIADRDAAVVLAEWPIDSVPAGAMSEVDSIYGRIARVDIPLGMPILENMVAPDLWDAAETGSDAALQVPPGMVAYAAPAARYSSAAWALRPGDHVDVILSLLMLDLDEEFQTVLPNAASCLTVGPEETCGIDIYGRLEVLPNGTLINVTPSEGQRPRLVTQLTVQDVLVLHVGDWPRIEDVAPEGEVIPIEEAPPDEAQPPPEPEVEPLTLALTRQDAMVLEYAQAIGARFTFVLRSAGDDESVATDSVTLQYLMDRFIIEQPPKLPYGITPPLSRLVPIGRSDVVGQYGAPAAPPAGQ